MPQFTGLLVLGVWLYSCVQPFSITVDGPNRTLMANIENGWIWGWLTSGFQGPVPTEIRNGRHLFLHAVEMSCGGPQASVICFGWHWRKDNCTFHVWPFALACLLPSAMAVIRRLRRPAGCCTRCGYDLRGSPTPCCSECGVLSVH